ncbi:MAG: hypothetical protein BWY31_00860 [Lentisphaerae bacterium ADurb.Bin242]|nr:MAG: hypothetical protein BWY31_00860 [Lentisphaerae bacterium ADurb.Bin242]
MKIRPYKPEDRRLLWELYNRFLHRDRLPEKAFLEYLLMSPNFQPEGCFFLPGRPAGAGIAMLHRKAFNPWTEIPDSSRGKGFLLPLADSAENYERILAEAERYFRKNGCSAVRLSGLGSGVLPNCFGRDEYPCLVETALRNGYESVHVSYAMRCGLPEYEPSEKIRKKREELAREGVIFRTCAPDDLPGVRDALENSDLAPYLPLILEKFSRGRLEEVVIAVENSGRVLATCQYHYAHQAERVGPFGVTASARGRGIGLVLVAALLEEMALRNYHCAYFHTCDEEKTRFYAQNQFQVFRVRDTLEKILH